jgi:GST-like protein
MLELYTAPTPNGWKVSILLEELGLDYETRAVNLSEGDQKKPEFLELNPNGRIPVIKDEELVLFESGAIMLYLAEKHQRFISSDPVLRYKTIQWLMFQMGGVGPMMGQANVFHRYFPEKIPVVIDRYQNEVKRLFGVLESHLSDGKEYLVDAYSIADIANWSWVHTANWSGVEIEPFPHLKSWVDRIYERPAVLKGKQVPYKVEKAQIKKAGSELIKS